MEFCSNGSGLVNVILMPLLTWSRSRMYLPANVFTAKQETVRTCLLPNRRDSTFDATATRLLRTRSYQLHGLNWYFS
ncbi:hypothetical protein Bca101_026869 [Brassica carinata]